MEKTKIKLDYVPAVNDIAEANKSICPTIPKEIKENPDFNYYGYVIFAHTILKEKNLFISDKQFGSVSEEDYATPFMADRISNRYVCIFAISSEDDTNLSADIYMIFDADKTKVQYLLCLDHTNQTHYWATKHEELINFLDLSPSLYLFDDQKSDSSN